MPAAVALARPSRKHDLLTAEQEVALGRRIADGDRAARDRLVECNFGLIRRVLANYRRFGADLEDLEQHGQIGLIIAAERFDPEMGTKFSTYATWWIRQKIQRAVDEEGSTIRVPSHVRVARRRIAKGLPPAVVDGRPAASDEALTAADRVLKCRPHGRTDPDEFDLIGQLPSKVAEPADPSLDLEIIPDLFKSLRGRERRILGLRFGLEDGIARTLEEVGDELGVSRERVRQIETKALARLRIAAERRASKLSKPLAWPATPPARATTTTTTTTTHEDRPMSLAITPDTARDEPADDVIRSGVRPSADATPDPVRRLTDPEKLAIRRLHDDHPGESPGRLADRFCRAYGWRPRPNVVGIVLNNARDQPGTQVELARPPAAPAPTPITVTPAASNAEIERAIAELDACKAVLLALAPFDRRAGLLALRRAAEMMGFVVTPAPG